MMLKEIKSVFLADDDKDDCFLFEEAFTEIGFSTQLTMVHDGEQLMQLLYEKPTLPNILFLDLNMPRKNGFKCLEEIKQDEKLKQLVVIIFSTSFQEDVANQLYENGAQYFLHKPADFDDLKKLIHKAITITEKDLAVSWTGQFGGLKGMLVQPAKENFLLS